MADTLVPTPSQTSGPLWGFALMFEDSQNAVDADSPGALRLEGRVFEAQEAKEKGLV